MKSDLQIVYRFFFIILSSLLCLFSSTLTPLRAKYHHVAPIPEWLDFHEGDVITQLPLDDPADEMLGWDRGRNATTGQVGMFPVAYAGKGVNMVV
jgi:hypothetical protein